MKKILLLMMALLLSISFSGCKAKEFTKRNYYQEDSENKLSFTFNAFDTSCSVTLYGEGIKSTGNQYVEDICQIVQAYEKNFSKTKEGSDIYNINHRTGDSVMISDLTATILEVAKGMNSWTDGRFDITSGTLVDLWDVKNRKEVPSKEEIIEARSHCNNYNYEIEYDEDSEMLICDTITFSGDKKSQIDLGALIKGYCCDSLKAVIEENENISAAMINLGGNVCCVGNLPTRDDGTFNVGIFKPFEGTEIIDNVKVKNRCVITSGNYERYFKVDGDDTIYHHILDPITGYPADTGLNSVTIISENGLLGDFLSTACMLLGKADSKDLIDFCSREFGDSNIQAIFVDNNNKVSKYPEKAKTY